MIDILYVNCHWVNLAYSRIMSTVFCFYTMFRLVFYQTLLIPKLPLRIHWKSILLITFFFSSTVFIIYPYCRKFNLFIHFYIFLLSIEASVWYYTKEFRLICRQPRHYYLDYCKAYYITVHRVI